MRDSEDTKGSGDTGGSGESESSSSSGVVRVVGVVGLGAMLRTGGEEGGHITAQHGPTLALGGQRGPQPALNTKNSGNPSVVRSHRFECACCD